MKKIRKYIYLIILIILAFLANCFNNMVLAKTGKNEESTEEKIRKYENIVFLGDSITDYYPIDEIYGDLPIINSGISGYKTTDILPRLEEMVYRYNPTSIYLLIGTNDLIQNKEEDKEQAIENIKEILKKITEKKKKAKIYVESIYPINTNLDKTKDMVGKRENETIMEVNEEIKKYCKENKYEYIDMYSELTDSDGNFSKEYTNDGLHPNDLGYAKITRILLPYIYGIK